MIKAVDIKAELAGRPVLSGRDKDTGVRPRAPCLRGWALFSLRRRAPRRPFGRLRSSR